jgi:hypothetical protein
MTEDQAQAIIDAFDDNGDGELQVDEFVKAMRAIDGSDGHEDEAAHDSFTGATSHREMVGGMTEESVMEAAGGTLIPDSHRAVHAPHHHGPHHHGTHGHHGHHGGANHSFGRANAGYGAGNDFDSF